MSLGPKLIWPNITITVTVVFEHILTLARIRYTVSSKRVILQTKMYYLVRYKSK